MLMTDAYDAYIKHELSTDETLGLILQTLTEMAATQHTISEQLQTLINHTKPEAKTAAKTAGGDTPKASSTNGNRAAPRVPKTAAKTRAKKAAHARWHTQTPNPECAYCQPMLNHASEHEISIAKHKTGIPIQAENVKHAGETESDQEERCLDALIKHELSMAKHRVEAQKEKRSPHTPLKEKNIYISPPCRNTPPLAEGNKQNQAESCNPENSEVRSPHDTTTGNDQQETTSLRLPGMYPAESERLPGNQPHGPALESNPMGATSTPNPGMVPAASDPPTTTDGTDFQTFWEQYPGHPGGKGSKKLAQTKWARLSKTQRQEALDVARDIAANGRYLPDCQRYLSPTSQKSWLTLTDQETRKPSPRNWEPPKRNRKDIDEDKWLDPEYWA